MTFAEKLVAFRIEHELSQADTAKIIGSVQSDVSQYEAGGRKPTKVRRAIFEKKMTAYEDAVRGRKK